MDFRKEKQMIYSSWVLLIFALDPLAALQDISHRHGPWLGGRGSEYPRYAHYDAAYAQVCVQMEDM